MPDPSKATLYWISGSTPSWRVMLALTLKGAAFSSTRLDAERGENKTEMYLRINLTGQVPTLVHGATIVRESIAILAYLDRAWPESPIFGETPEEAARVWQRVMIFENTLAEPAGVVARALLRGTSRDPATHFEGAVVSLLERLSEVDDVLSSSAFLIGAEPSAADIWLYPLLGWLNRAIETTDDPVPDRLATWATDRAALSAWRGRFSDLPGVAETYPPHWRPISPTPPSSSLNGEQNV